MELLEKDQREPGAKGRRGSGEREKGGGRNLSVVLSVKRPRLGGGEGVIIATIIHALGAENIARGRANAQPRLSPFISYLPGFLSDLLHLSALLRCVYHV